ncbi:hypothetical protein GYMLUDRAFT_37148 [Collybiopsis luxurians FD-317 M1]|nr:hypothetical protein GYMLUDRAFT_37148 [Collybiopsis luxurians FD-317 M1]
MTWFVVQLLARWARRLPVTQLETMTVAYAALNVLTYFFWWSKPQGVGRPICITQRGTDEEVVDQSSASSQPKERWPLSLRNWFRNILNNGLDAVHNYLDRLCKRRPEQHRSYKDILLDGLCVP